MERKLLGKFDIIITVAVLAIMVLLIFPLRSQKGDVKAVIYYNGEVIREIKLTDNQESFDLNVGNCKVRVDKNTVYFVSSPCPDKICINSGKLSKGGQFASCVPEKVTIILKGNKGDNPDVLTY